MDDEEKKIPKKKRANGVYHFDMRFTPKEEESPYTPEYFEEKWVDVAKDTFRHFFDKWIFQLERGEGTGRLHLQCYAHKVEKDRPNHLGALLGDSLPGITVRPCSTNGVKALREYAMKKDTRLKGPWADKEIYMGQDLITELRPWQKIIKKQFEEPPHPRYGS